MLGVSATSAQAVQGGTYATYTSCYAAGQGGAGTLHGESVTWTNFSCPSIAGGGYRLHVFGVNQLTGGTYGTYTSCRAAGLGGTGTYYGEIVDWTAFACAPVGSSYRLLIKNVW